MSRSEQIENMARAIHMNCHKGLTSSEATMIAKWCYQEIDRKASKLAEEIFEEIEKLFFKNGVFIHIQSYNELKKKYTEEKK